MLEVSTIGLDVAKQVFQVHGSDGSGRVVFRKQLRRDELLRFLGGIEPCVVAMEACGSAHHWGRETAKLGHEVLLIAPIYVKPFVKRQKNDAADAEAICEAAQRPTMRYVAVKSEAAQAAGVVFRTRDLLVRQRTQAINALRDHLAEFGIVAPKGAGHVATLIARLREPGSMVPEAARIMLDVLVDTLVALDAQVARLDREIASRARSDADARRLMTIPKSRPRRRADHRDRAGGARTRGRPVCARPRLCRLARPHPRCNIRPAASSGSGGPRKWANAASGSCSSSVPVRWSARPSGAAHPPDHGSRACSRPSRACSSSSRSPIKWRASSGP